MKDQNTKQFAKELPEHEKPEFYTPDDLESIAACNLQDTIHLIRDEVRKDIRKK